MILDKLTVGPLVLYRNDSGQRVIIVKSNAACISFPNNINELDVKLSNLSTSFVATYVSDNREDTISIGGTINGAEDNVFTLVPTDYTKQHLGSTVMSGFMLRESEEIMAEDIDGSTTLSNIFCTLKYSVLPMVQARIKKRET